MSEWTLSTPVVLLIYDRPETTHRVFERVASVEPPDLYVVADGPANEADRADCEAARDVIDVTWDGALHTNYADENLGLRRRIPSGLDWAFDEVDRAIVLEDDCLPSEDFFRYCEVLLERYADDERVMEITGYNPLERWKPGRQDYHFSFLGGIWGWATWAQAWDEYDESMELWTEDEVRDRIGDVLAHDGLYRRKRRLLDRVYEGEIDTWDYQWQLARWVNSGLSAVPSRNLVTNIGFGSDSTNTADEDDPRSGVERYDLSFPLSEPSAIGPDREYDSAVYDGVLRGRFQRFMPDRVYDALLRHGDSLPV